MVALDFGTVSVSDFQLPAGAAPDRQFSFFLSGSGLHADRNQRHYRTGLTFGNSWQVIGVVIAALWLWPIIANCVVQWLNIERPLCFRICSCLTGALGWWVAKTAGCPRPGRPVGTAMLLTSPDVFLRRRLFRLLKSRGEISGMMAMNLFGAMCGGLLEYNSMYFGFRFLYLIRPPCICSLSLGNLSRLNGKGQQLLQRRRYQQRREISLSLARCRLKEAQAGNRNKFRSCHRADITGDFCGGGASECRFFQDQVQRRLR